MNITVVRVPSHMVYDLIGTALELTPKEREQLQVATLSTTKIWVGYVGDDLIGILGLVEPTLCSNKAYLWLHTTPEAKNHTFNFVRQSQRLVEEIRKEHPILHGHTLIKHEQSIRWLKWLGAKFGPPQGQVLPFQIGNEA